MNSLEMANSLLSLTDEGESCQNCEFLMLQICLYTIFLEIKFLQKVLTLQ